MLVIATCGLVYELLAGTLASYVLGDSVTQFSLIIGIYLIALGVGAWLSRFVDRRLARAFIEVETGRGAARRVVGPAAVFQLRAAGLVSCRALRGGFRDRRAGRAGVAAVDADSADQLDFKELVSPRADVRLCRRVVGSLLFPLLLVPRLGLVRTSLVFGMLNAVVGLWGTWLLRPLIEGGLSGLRFRRPWSIAILAVGLVEGRPAHVAGRRRPVCRSDRLRPNHALSADRDHARAGPAFNCSSTAICSSARPTNTAITKRWCIRRMAAGRRAARVLVLGGGDGLAVREILKYPSVEESRSSISIPR